MSDTYKGESPGKKWARYNAWLAIARLLPDFYSTQSRFLVLASREGGDISLLQGVCVPPGQIDAVDTCHEAVVECRGKFPAVNVVHADVAEYAERNPNFSVAFLDFCAHLGPELFETVRRVVCVAPLGSVVAVAYLKGREKISSAEMAPVLLNRAHARRVKRRFRMLKTETDILRGRGKDFRAALQEAKPLDGGLSRARTLASMLRATTGAREPVLAGVIDYHSRTKSGHGVPMQIAILVVGSHGLSDRERRLYYPKASWWRKFSATEDSLRRAVLSGTFDPNAHLVLNIPKTTITAWKAHSTRGVQAAGAA